MLLRIISTSCSASRFFERNCVICLFVKSKKGRNRKKEDETGYSRNRESDVQRHRNDHDSKPSTSHHHEEYRETTRGKKYDKLFLLSKVYYKGR